MIEELFGGGNKRITRGLELRYQRAVPTLDNQAQMQETGEVSRERRAEPVRSTHARESLMKEEEPGIKRGVIRASVIVNAYNEEAEISRLLESLKKSWFPGMEVIISNDGSTDRTAAIVKKYVEADPGEKPPDWLILENHENLGIPGAKNLGAARARGDYLFFFDSDAPLPAGMLQEDLRQMEERNLDIASHELAPQIKLQKYRTALKNKIIIDLVNREQGKSAIAGCGGILMKKSIFREVGGFRNMPIGEDTDIWQRVKKRPGSRAGLIEGVKMPVNMRRFEKQGHATTFLKWLRAWLGDVFNEKNRDQRSVQYGPARRNPPISQQE